jgi:hypothetical protein
MSWSATDLALNGTFASADDLQASVDQLHRITGGPVVVVTFSRRLPLRSLTTTRDEDGAESRETVDRLSEELSRYLGSARARDKHQYVAQRVVQSLAALGCTSPSTVSFGGGLEQSGRLAVVVGGDGVADGPARAAAEHAATCALGSRPAAVSLETTLELATLSVLRKVTEHAGPEPEFDVATTRSRARYELLKFATGVLGTVAVIAYEASPERPNRFDRLELAEVCPNFGMDLPPWLPDDVVLTTVDEVPAPPELGGSRFKNLGTLVNLCFESAGRPRPLSATIDGRYIAYGVPYGFDEVRRRPIGVVCLLWSSHNIGVYDMAMSRVVALHLARLYNSRHRDWSVRLVTQQLKAISEMRDVPSRRLELDCHEILARRDDVRLIAPTVLEMLRGLVNLSGALSVTCRLVAGAQGDHLERFLVRLHCEGDSSKKRSPGMISLTKAESANAWVARHGRHVYLRELRDGTSPDLRSYHGLQRLSIYRDNVSSELCVPIFAERRLVGTINLEADRQHAFDALSETVAEYAHVIGVALLEARRKINVDTVTQVGGFLDHRHRLEGGLMRLSSSLSRDKGIPTTSRRSYVEDLHKIHRVVFMRVADMATFGSQTSLHDVVTAAMTSLKWTSDASDLSSLTLDPWSQEVQSVLEATLSQDAARALWFALGQALYNVRQHSDGGHVLAGRGFPAMFRFGESPVGGARSVYLAVSSTCDESTFYSLNPEVVFRQPIHNGERMSLGTFLAGEALRRVGGSAYMRVTKSDDGDCFVDAEFSVPANPPARGARSRRNGGPGPMFRSPDA